MRNRGVVAVAAWRVASSATVALALGFAPGNQVVAASETSKGPFHQRWSMPVAGEVVGLEATNDELYAVVDGGSSLEVVAFDLAGGTVRWRNTVLHDCSSYGYDGSATDYGLLLTFGVSSTESLAVVGTTDWPDGTDGLDGDVKSAADCDAADDHLLLLDADSGKARWDVPLHRPVDDVFGQVNDHVAVISTFDSALAFVDLDTGIGAAAGGMGLPGGPGWIPVGDEMALVGDGVLTVGWDPFDPAAPTSDVALPRGTVGVTSSGDGDLLVAKVGTELVGIVDGEEAWRWTPHVQEVGAVTIFEGIIGVYERRDGMFRGTQFGRIGDAGVEPFDVFPDTLRFDAVWDGGGGWFDTAGGGFALVGILDDTSGWADSDERVSAVTVELEAGTPVRTITDDLNGLASVGVFGSYIYTASPLDGEIWIYDMHSLEVVDSIPLPDTDDFEVVDFIALADGILVFDADQSTLSAYA